MLSLFAQFALCLLYVVESSYKLLDEYSGTTFFDGFYFLHDQECVHSSFSNFITNITKAYEMGIIATRNNSVYIGTDYKTIFPLNSTIGRASLCIGTKKRYKTGLFILDASHMPFGCGTWPSWWMTDGNYHANISEYDTIEGVNIRTNDVSAFHTKSTNCSFSSVASNKSYVSQSMSGQWQESSNCSFYAQHCSISPQNNSSSYGQLFNQQNGGVYATEIYLYPNNTDNNQTQYEYGYLRSWFWIRNEIPIDIKNKNPDPSLWKLPYANFPFGKTPKIVNNGCLPHVINTYHQIRFDLYYCGVAGNNPWNKCKNITSNLTCTQFVNQNASYFKNAYWTINYMDIYHL